MTASLCKRTKNIPQACMCAFTHACMHVQYTCIPKHKAACASSLHLTSSSVSAKKSSSCSSPRTSSRQSLRALNADPGHTLDSKPSGEAPTARTRPAARTRDAAPAWTLGHHAAAAQASGWRRVPPLGHRRHVGVLRRGLSSSFVPLQLAARQLCRRLARSMMPAVAIWCLGT